MRIQLKLVGVMIVLGTPCVAAPALAQPGWTSATHSSASQVAAHAQTKPPVHPQARAPRVSQAARQAIAAAPFDRARPRRIDLTVRGDDRLRDDVELRQKDAWTDEEGFQVKATKLAFTRRF